MRIKRKIIINAPIEKTYRTAENYPLFVKAFREKKILWNTELASKVRITNDFFAIPLTWEGESIKRKIKQIDWVQTSGLLKGLRANWLFNSIDDGQTEVLIKGEFFAKGLRKVLLYPLAPILVAKVANQILTSLKMESELW